MDSKKQGTTVKKQSTKSKKANNQMIRVDPTSVQELNQLVCDLVNCPIHVTNVLKRLTTKKTGKSYFKCTVKNCPVFCFEDKLGNYCNAIATNLMAAYKSYTPMCGCDRPSNLRVSNSQDNPQRPYFTCGQKVTCEFFQWGDEELTDKNFELITELEEKRQMKRIAKEQFLYKLGNPTPIVIPTAEEIDNFLACIK